MEFRNNKLTCEQVNQMDIVDYLADLGIYPSKVQGADHWYLSLLRNEKSASFKVNKRINAWYDHGSGLGGNLVDFGVRYHRCTVKELLMKLTHNFPFHQQIHTGTVAPKEQQDSSIKIVSENDITSFSLRRYLRQRRISGSIAQEHCREVIFELQNRQYEALGFRNNQGGYELRNPWFKGSSSPKDITTLTAGEKEITVFEGFFDFLTYKTIFQNQSPLASDFLILNSLSFVERARATMDRYERINLYLDQDNAGLKCSRDLMTSSPKFLDQSALYKGYKDLNDWVQLIGKSNNQKLKRGL